MPKISVHEEFLYKNFELLFSKEPIPCGDERIYRLENRFSIDDKTQIQTNTNIEKNEYLKTQFDELRKTINEIINSEKQLNMSGGSMSPLTDIKQYIINKIKDIIPRD
jgi:hypothetical protein